MTADEVHLLHSVVPSCPAEAPAGWTVTRALRRAARMMTQRSLRTHRFNAKTHGLRRVLLIVPPSDSRSVVPTAVLSPLGLAGLAESLRAAGFEAEIYDAMATSLGAQSIRLHMEHSYPQVVAAAAHGSTSEAARDVLRVAKEVIPGVFTVLLGARSALVTAKAPKDASVDCVVDDSCAETLPGLLARLRVGEQLGRITASRAA